MDQLRLVRSVEGRGQPIDVAVAFNNSLTALYPVQLPIRYSGWRHTESDIHFGKSSHRGAPIVGLRGVARARLARSRCASSC